jgi:protein subunit release factor A
MIRSNSIGLRLTYYPLNLVVECNSPTYISQRKLFNSALHILRSKIYMATQGVDQSAFEYDISDDEDTNSMVDKMMHTRRIYANRS